MAVLTLYKNRGETPLECINRFKKDNPEYKNEKMTYAGRLDPLAEGLLLVLTGEDCKKKEEYLGLDKEYEVDVLFGFATDTYDVLGKVTGVIPVQTGIQNLDSRLRGNDLQKILESFVGRFSQKYPAYSSKYFNEARSGELDEEKIDSKDVEIKSIELTGQSLISKADLETFVKDSIALVKGDFRQEEILESWEKAFCLCEGTEAIQGFNIISLKVSCTSGTYMRTLANSIGEKLGIPALALQIKRTKVGEFKI